MANLQHVVSSEYPVRELHAQERDPGHVRAADDGNDEVHDDGHEQQLEVPAPQAQEGPEEDGRDGQREDMRPVRTAGREADEDGCERIRDEERGDELGSASPCSSKLRNVAVEEFDQPHDCSAGPKSRSARGGMTFSTAGAAHLDLIRLAPRLFGQRQEEGIPEHGAAGDGGRAVCRGLQGVSDGEKHRSTIGDGRPRVVSASAGSSDVVTYWVAGAAGSQPSPAPDSLLSVKRRCLVGACRMPLSPAS